MTKIIAKLSHSLTMSLVNRSTTTAREPFRTTYIFGQNGTYKKTLYIAGRATRTVEGTDSEMALIRRELIER